MTSFEAPLCQNKAERVSKKLKMFGKCYDAVGNQKWPGPISPILAFGDNLMLILWEEEEENRILHAVQLCIFSSIFYSKTKPNMSPQIFSD